MTTQMLDVDFLNDPSATLRPHIVYVYDTGILRPHVKKRVRGIVKADNYMMTRPSERVFDELYTPSLMEEAVVECDFGEIDVVNEWKHDIKPALKAIAAATTINRAFLMAPVQSFVIGEALWREVVATATFIEETSITSDSVAAVLRFLMSDTDLYQFSRLRNRSAFCKSFAQPGSAGPSSLPEFIAEFEAKTLTQIDPATNLFSAAVDRGMEAVRHTREGVKNPLQAFLASNDPWHLVWLVQQFDREFRRDRTINKLISNLYQATGELLLETTRHPIGKARRPVSLRRGCTARVPAVERVRWTAMSLAWEVRLARGDFCMKLDRLGRDFIARGKGASLSDALDGLWPEIMERLVPKESTETDRLAVARTRMVDRLHRCMETIPEDDIAANGLLRLRSTLNAVFDCHKELGSREMELARHWR